MSLFVAPVAPRLLPPGHHAFVDPALGKAIGQPEPLLRRVVIRPPDLAGGCGDFRSIETLRYVLDWQRRYAAFKEGR